MTLAEPKSGQDGTEKEFSFFRRLSIDHKLLVVSLLISAIALGASSIAFILYDVIQFRRALVHDMSALTEVIAHNCEAALVFSDRADAKETLDTLRGRPSVVSARLYGPDGSILARYEREEWKGNPIPFGEAKEGWAFEQDHLIIHKIIRLEGSDIGRISVLSDLSDLEAMLKADAIIIFVILSASLLLAAMVSSRLSKIIANPIVDLSKLAQSVSREKDYSIRARKQSDDELGSLVRSFNEMLTQIENRDAALQESKKLAEKTALEARALADETRRINTKLEKEITERQKAEEELQDYRQHLEDIVKKRTAQLMEVNLRLQREIKERMEVEEDLKISLGEKVALLGETHHRVKNNLQIITSLLDMTKKRTDNREAVEILSEAHARIHTMALIHTQLYETDRFDHINMQEHIRELIRHLSYLYAHQIHIKPVIRAPSIHLSVTQAIPCALILNELITNALKYAFSEKESGILEVSMSPENGRMIMTVKDNGTGIPKYIDIDEPDSLGLKLVRNITEKQLGGTVQINRHQGTEFLIAFPQI